MEYRIHASASAAGPYAVVGAVTPPAPTAFVHAGAAAGAGARFYYITTVENGVPPVESTPSDTVSTIHLQVLQSTPLGNANLLWTMPQPASSAGPSYAGWMEYPLGTWTQLDATPSSVFNYAHVVSVCDDSLAFRIERSDASGCVSVSNVGGDRFEDVTPPSAPVISSVSVDSLTGLSTISWEPSPQGDTDGYIILWSTPGGGVIIDTVYGQNNTVYTWANSNPAVGPEAFTVASFDTCQVGVPPSPNTSATRAPHRTMHLITTYDRCRRELNLTWSAYQGWPVLSHQLLVSVDGGPWNTLANLGGDASSYLHAVEPGRSYCYIVKADRQGAADFSLSNRACRNADYPAVPVFNYVRTVTVLADDLIQVEDSVDGNARSGGFRIERSANGAPFELRATHPPVASGSFIFQDDEVDAAQVGYRYRVVALDSCGTDAVTSNIGGNMLLRAEPRLDGANVLTWNGYSQWAGEVQGHLIERSVDDGPFQQVGLVPPDPWLHVDDVQALLGSNGRICYQVRALEGDNPYGSNANSLSNVACAVQEELIYIPNAFIVGGANPVFLPVLSYVDITSYELVIINRWGQQVWSTTDPLEGWDGRIGGQLMPTGVYGYFCTVRNGAGKRVEKRGTVTLLTSFE